MNYNFYDILVNLKNSYNEFSDNFQDIMGDKISNDMYNPILNYTLSEREAFYESNEEEQEILNLLNELRAII